MAEGRLVVNKSKEAKPVEQVAQQPKKNKITAKMLLLHSLNEMKDGVHAFYVLQIASTNDRSPFDINEKRSKSGSYISHIHILQQSSMDHITSLIDDVTDDLIFAENPDTCIYAFGACYTMREAQDFIDQIIGERAGGIMILQHIPKVINYEI